MCLEMDGPCLTTVESLDVWICIQDLFVKSLCSCTSFHLLQYFVVSQTLQVISYGLLVIGLRLYQEHLHGQSGLEKKVESFV